MSIPYGFVEVSPGVFEKPKFLPPDDAKTGREGVDDEGKLHNQIIAFCDSQWPRFKYAHARTDKKSTLAKGVADFTIFLPSGKVLVIECKTKDGKLSPEQLSWKKEMSMIGHEVHIVRSMQEFLKLL